ncbi:MAG: hypothetical protein J5644_06165 [Bacteroidales bacterium]|nr:hypothetical protein [Bacteroidales bacterium]
MKKIIYLALVAFFVGFFSTSCEKEEQQRNHIEEHNTTKIQLNENTLLDITGSSFMLKLLNSAEIIKVICEDDCTYNVISRNNDNYNVKIDKNGYNVIVNIEKNTYVLHLDEEKFVFEDINNNVIEAYTSIEGVSENINEKISTAFAMLYYYENIGNIPYTMQAPQVQDTQTYCCIHFRKSWCNKDMLQEMEDFCGGTPTYTGETDCGCLWGDFFCICLTDFEC